jgi:hypothetical protein
MGYATIHADVCDARPALRTKGSGIPLAFQFAEVPHMADNNAFNNLNETKRSFISQQWTTRARSTTFHSIEARQVVGKNRLDAGTLVARTPWTRSFDTVQRCHVPVSPKLEVSAGTAIIPATTSDQICAWGVVSAFSWAHFAQTHHAYIPAVSL